MSASTAIGMASSSLRNVLINRMRLNLTVDVTVLAPDEQGGDRRVNLFLYRLEENPHLRNQDATIDPGPPGRLVPPPLSLILYYLVTAYAPNDALTGNSTAHHILGEAMRVLHEYPVLPRDDLDVGLRLAREDLQVVAAPLDAEELSRIWSTFARPFRPSVLYQVSTVQIDVREDEPEAPPRRVRRTGVPGVRTGLDRPVVHRMAPTVGSAGSTLTFTGDHLPGWSAGVTFGGRTVLDDVELTGPEFTATVPAGVGAGVYDVQVEVAGLFRRTFPFEVSP